MANKNFFQPRRMESQEISTKLYTALSAVEVFDGALVTLGDFADSYAYGASIKDFNTRMASLTTAGASGVWAVDIAGVATKTGQGNTVRDGYNTIGLSVPTGIPFRTRKLMPEDIFSIGSGNCGGTLEVGKFATVGANGMYVPAATAPETGAYFKVVDNYTLSQGVDGDVVNGKGVTAYTLVVVRN